MSTGVTVFEALQRRTGDKRCRQRNNDASDVEGYLGPWGKFVDEQTVMKPSEVVSCTEPPSMCTATKSNFVLILLNCKIETVFTCYVKILLNC